MNNPATPTDPPRKATLLLVDDTPENLSILSDLLKDSYRILVARSGERALKLAAEQQPDLILLDIMMPKLSGFEVCKRLRADPATRDIGVIMVTALDQPADIERAVDAHTDDLITKPISKAELLVRVRALLEARRRKPELERTLAYIDGVESGTP